MKAMHAEMGETVRFSKTVGETDVYMFAGVTGDFSGNHVNEEFMKKSKVWPPHRAWRASRRLYVDGLDDDDRTEPREGHQIRRPFLWAMTVSASSIRSSSAIRSMSFTR